MLANSKRTIQTCNASPAEMRVPWERPRAAVRRARGRTVSVFSAHRACWGMRTSPARAPTWARARAWVRAFWGAPRFNVELGPNSEQKQRHGVAWADQAHGGLCQLKKNTTCVFRSLEAGRMKSSSTALMSSRTKADGRACEREPRITSHGVKHTHTQPWRATPRHAYAYRRHS